VDAPAKKRAHTLRDQGIFICSSISYRGLVFQNSVYTCAGPIAMPDNDLPSGWEVRYSKSKGGKEYYFCPATKESRWEKPTAKSERKRPAETSGNDSKRPKPVSGEKVKCSHILKKHKDSRRPVRTRDGVEEDVTRTKDEALALIEGFRAEIKDQKRTFGEIAKAESDCSSYKRGGDLGKFGRQQMQKPFEDVAFALALGEMSKPVFTDSGCHIIIRTD